MALLSAWADSIAFLWTDNGKLALYGLYKAIRETYWVLIVKFWWFILFFFVMGRFVPLLPEIKYFFALIWTVVTILIVRPSMGKKDYSYFAHYIYFIIAAAFLGLLFSMLLKPFLRSFLLGLFSLSKGIYSPIYLSIVFFMSESSNIFSSAIKNIVQGLKMIFYNYPLFLIIHSLLFIGWKFIFMPGIIYASKPLTIIFGPLYFYYVRIFLLPIYICIVNTLYILRRAAQPDLYEVL